MIPLAMIAQIMIVYLLKASENAQHYQYLAVMIVVYSNITQRLGVDFAQFVSVSACVIYAAFLLAAWASLEIALVGASATRVCRAVRHRSRQILQ